MSSSAWHDGWLFANSNFGTGRGSTCCLWPLATSPILYWPFLFYSIVTVCMTAKMLVRNDRTHVQSSQFLQSREMMTGALYHIVYSRWAWRLFQIFHSKWPCLALPQRRVVVLLEEHPSYYNNSLEVPRVLVLLMFRFGRFGCAGTKLFYISDVVLSSANTAHHQGHGYPNASLALFAVYSHPKQLGAISRADEQSAIDSAKFHSTGISHVEPLYTVKYKARALVLSICLYDGSC